MSVNLPDVAVKEFEAEVHAEYQSRGFKSRDAVRMRRNVVGSQLQFPKSGQGIAQQKALQADVVPMNVDYSPVSLTLQNWHASDYSDIFAQAEVNFDERMELVRTSAMSIGRRMDQMVIDALDASGTANTIAAGGANFTYAKVREAIGLLHKNNAGDNGIYCFVSAGGEEKLLSETSLTSSDFVNSRVIENGGLSGLKLAGVNWIVVGDMEEGGLPLTGSDRTCFMWDKVSIGMGIGIDFRTEINYVAEKLSYLVSSLFKANATAIDAAGIVDITIDESVA